MLFNYILVAIRNIRRHRFFSAINILGLSVSMAVCMAVIMLVADQLMYDRFNTNGKSIYRVTSRPVTSAGTPTGGMDNATTPLALRDELMNNYTGVSNAVRLKRGFGNHWMEIEGRDINIPVSGYYADPEVLQFFQYELEEGDASTALKEPFTVVLTREAADRMFEEENPVGLTLKVDKDLYKVTGILKKTNRKSHIVFDGLASMATVKSMQAAGRGANELDNWFNYWEGWTYIMTDESEPVQNITEHLNRIYEKRIAINKDPEQYRAKFQLQPLFEITPGAFINNPIGPSMPWIIVGFLSGLAVIIMLTSCFNFTNLSIARALSRAREIGVRKVNGASRRNIVLQFLSESVIVSLFALLIGLLGVWMIKPFLLQLNFARLFHWDMEANGAVYLACLIFAITVGLIAGIVPAMMLSGFQPVKVLKKLHDVRLFSRLTLRKGIIVAQFALSLIFILTVIVLHNQLDLFLGKDHGFNHDNNIVVRLNGAAYDPFKSALSQYSNIESIAAASHLPATGESRGSGFSNEATGKDWVTLLYFSVDEGYADNLSLPLVVGRYFDATNPKSNSDKIVINEEALKPLHYASASEALGQQIMFQEDSTRKTIIGVLKNYNHQILLMNISPMALLYRPENFDLVHVKYSGDKSAAMNSISAAWKAAHPDFKMDAGTMNEKMEVFYETTLGDLVRVVSAIAALAVFISCMGLMGMATYSTEIRTKEISIRKVLGSSDAQIIRLLSGNFMKLIMLSLLIGTPLAWLLNNQWLQMLAYRTTVDVRVIVLSSSLLLVLGLITIGSQTIRAAFMNPVDNLRNE
ncbi:ABC transporter permease [Chryseolinea sp. T2]|uniref:ABC transporter permease n=1 Tax=Chryseolinea sp. T2 TaxID=3129255 RepID=UPI003076EA82